MSSNLHPRRGGAVLASCLVAIALASMVSGCERQPSAVATEAAPAFKAVDITGASYAKELSLPDADGKVRTLADFAGQIPIVFFGYTQCPDVCPTTMIDLAQVKKMLGPDGAKVRGIFVSLDPERDTPEVLGAYVRGFGDDFVGLRGTPEQTKATAQHFKVFFSRVAGKTPSSYTIDHTAGSFVFDAQGKVRLFLRHGAKPEDMVADLKRLLS